ncbi:MAG TPA: multicopper oxidase domain-containing protein [Ktedonobacteraceae bacterium]|nr:multicopper oxidase domain-containing protein [Ktedonobacteraceae bacterium]
MTGQSPDSSQTSDTQDTISPTPGTETDTSGITRRGLLRGAAVGAASLGTLGSLALPPTASAATVPHIIPATTIPQAASHPHPSVEFPRAGKLREYWVQADSFVHNIMPTGLDGMTGDRFTPSQTSFWAIGYRAFTPNWGKVLPGDDDIGPNTGIPGPIFRAEVGDTVRVHFRNNDTYYKKPHTIAPHAFKYTVEHDGGWAWMLQDRPGTNIEVGQTYTYEWTAIPRSVGTWPYHDHSKHFDPGRGTVVMEAGAALGLFGMIIVTDANTPKVDKEIMSVWHSFYEGDIPGLTQNYHCINGYAYLGNTPTPRVKVGQSVRWRVIALSNDFHTFHVHGHTWQHAGQFTDCVVIGPGVGHTFEYVEDAAPGLWYYHCHVTMHVMGPGMGGMIGLYEVIP